MRSCRRCWSSWSCCSRSRAIDARQGRPVKTRPLALDAALAARRVRAEFGLADQCDLHVEALAEHLGLRILYGPATTARGWIARVGRRAIIHVDERVVGLPAARFTIAHEAGHFLLHPLEDHLSQCADAPPKRGDAQYRMEREANDFATELLIPESLGAGYCAMARPTLHDVDRLGEAFGTSLEMSAIRMVQLSPAPCAVMLALQGRVKWAIETAAFPGRIALGRTLHPESIAASMALDYPCADRAARVPGVAWEAPVALFEHSMSLHPRPAVLSWIIAAG